MTASSAAWHNSPIIRMFSALDRKGSRHAFRDELARMKIRVPASLSFRTAIDVGHDRGPNQIVHELKLAPDRNAFFEAWPGELCL